MNQSVEQGPAGGEQHEAVRSQSQLNREHRPAPQDSPETVEPPPRVSRSISDLILRPRHPSSREANLADSERADLRQIPISFQSPDVPQRATHDNEKGDNQSCDRGGVAFGESSSVRPSSPHREKGTHAQRNEGSRLAGRASSEEEGLLRARGWAVRAEVPYFLEPVGGESRPGE